MKVVLDVVKLKAFTQVIEVILEVLYLLDLQIASQPPWMQWLHLLKNFANHYLNKFQSLCCLILLQQPLDDCVICAIIRREMVPIHFLLQLTCFIN